jgi:hypothetical protein
MRKVPSISGYVIEVSVPSQERKSCICVLETYKKNVGKPNFSGLICFLLNMNTCMYIFVKLDILTRFMPFKKKNNI